MQPHRVIDGEVEPQAQAGVRILGVDPQGLVGGRPAHVGEAGPGGGTVVAVALEPGSPGEPVAAEGHQPDPVVDVEGSRRHRAFQQRVDVGRRAARIGTPVHDGGDPVGDVDDHGPVAVAEADQVHARTLARRRPGEPTITEMAPISDSLGPP